MNKLFIQMKNYSGDLPLWKKVENEKETDKKESEREKEKEKKKGERRKRRRRRGYIKEEP